MTVHKIRVFLVDDHPLVREWLANMINQQADLIVCGEAEDAPRALQTISTLQPQVAIVDISLKSGSGLELIKDINHTCPKVVVIVLSMHDELLYGERAFRAGARGYVMKQESTTKMTEAIRCVLGGKRYMSSRLSAAMAEKMAEGQQADMSPSGLLSDRELEVFELLGQAQETRAIAESLHISMKTVQAFCARIKDKLNLHTERELLREAVRWQEDKTKR